MAHFAAAAGGKMIPDWVKDDYYHKVMQTIAYGKAVQKGGKVCVLLGKKMRKADGVTLVGINTWVALDNLALAATKDSLQETYTVKSGDTLWSIALDKLGSGLRYPEIMKLNALPSTVLQIGQKLRLPK